MCVSCLTFNYVHANTLCVLLQVIRVFGSGVLPVSSPGCPRGFTSYWLMLVSDRMFSGTQCDGVLYVHVGN